MKTPNASKSDRMLNPKELAEYLHVTIQWVYDQVAYGRIPYYKVGKYLRFRLEEVLDLMRGQDQ